MNMITLTRRSQCKERGLLVTNAPLLSQNKTQQKWLSRAPANTMILGEHSVVYGHPAIACALDQFITIDWQARQDSEIHISSELAHFQTDIQHLNTHPKLRFVGLALQAFKPHLSFGLNIDIKSEFSSTIGLGSSAAVLAATLHGLNVITQQKYSTLSLFEMGHAIIMEIQGRGSGTDLAASLTGGVIYFEPKSPNQSKTKITKLPHVFPLCLIYAGYKTPTADVLALVAQQWQDQPKQLAALYQAMGNTTQQAFKSLNSSTETFETPKTLSAFYQSLQTYQQLMDQLGVNDSTLSILINSLQQCPSIHAAKISGSGLGDCVLGLGNLKACDASQTRLLSAYQQLQVNITPLGAETHTQNDKHNAPESTEFK